MYRYMHDSIMLNVGPVYPLLRVTGTHVVVEAPVTRGCPIVIYGCS